MQKASLNSVSTKLQKLHVVKDLWTWCYEANLFSLTWKFKQEVDLWRRPWEPPLTAHFPPSLCSGVRKTDGRVIMCNTTGRTRETGFALMGNGYLRIWKWSVPLWHFHSPAGTSNLQWETVKDTGRGEEENDWKWNKKIKKNNGSLVGNKIKTDKFMKCI